VQLIIQPEAGIDPIVRAIRQAKRRIDICIFRFDQRDIERALAEAVQKHGVVVRALIAHTNRGGEAKLRKLEQRLLDAGLSVTRTADELLRYHGKFLVVDDMLHVFGFNFTKMDIGKSRSFGIATRDKRTVNEAVKLFEADLARNPYQPTASNLVVSPESSRQMLTDFLSGAKRELAIYDEKISDPAIVKLLKELAAGGIRVRVLGKLKGPDGDVLERSFKPMRLHVRAIIRDGTRAFVGSQSLRTLELDGRREVGLLVNNPAVTRKLMEVFEADWIASAKDRAPKEPENQSGDAKSAQTAVA
jgi:phosphatidylserine/phosphatidylglycerophosphate/cardiolipin synthase-like enzyme